MGVGIFFFWILCGMGAAIAARGRGRSIFGWLVLGFLLGPFAILFVLLLPKYVSPERRSGLLCPVCKAPLEFKQPHGNWCPRCRMAINIDPESPEAAPETVSLDNETKKCPDCAEFIKFEAVKCRFCGKEFDPEEVKRQVTARLAELDHTGKTQCPLCKKWDVEPRQPFDKWCPHCKQAV